MRAVSMENSGRWSVVSGQWAVVSPLVPRDSSGSGYGSVVYPVTFPAFARL
jgi:hypothetical protein